MSNLESRMEAMERRLRLAEDRLEIFQLLASYGPAVDSLSEDVLRSMWTVDGVYDPHGINPYVGNEAVGGLIHGPAHQRYVHQGCAHVTSLPRVTIDGDRAVATAYSRLYLRE